MSLVRDGVGWSEAQLIEELREIREHFNGMERSFSSLPPELPHGYPVESLRRFLASTIALADSVLTAPAPPRKILIQTLNELHECLKIVPYVVHAAQSDCSPFPGHSTEEFGALA